MKPTGNKRQLELLRRYAFDLLVDGGKAVLASCWPRSPTDQCPRWLVYREHLDTLPDHRGKVDLAIVRARSETI